MKANNNGIENQQPKLDRLYWYNKGLRIYWVALKYFAYSRAVDIL